MYLVFVFIAAVPAVAADDDGRGIPVPVCFIF